MSPLHLRLAASVLPLAFILLLALLLSLIPIGARATPDPSTGRPDQTALTTLPTAGALRLSSIPSGYLSPETEAPRPFTHALLRWEAFEPADETIALELRVSFDGVNWTPWGLVEENPDLWVPADGEEVHWGTEIYAGEGARFWQIRATLTPAPDGSMPELRRVELNTIDARFGPRDPLPEQPRSPGARTSVGKPGVVSRSAWGNPDGQGSRVRPVHYPVNHLVIHHTADSNNLGGGQQSWADRVRAIWSFHTYTRGWGDIGYNYLVDPNGVIYEGRAGGDDAVGFHDTANYGSMGVVLIGTYASVDPPAAGLDSLVELLAWKADQKRIDPLGRSFYYGCSISRYCNPFTSGAIVENIAGHRQVTPGHTSCPGDRLLERLPELRQRVQARLSGQSGGGDDGDLTIDELERSFGRSDSNWYAAGCGYGGHALYTYATDNPAESSNSGLWRPNIPAAGRYKVLAHIPAGCGAGTPTERARYSISSAEGQREVIINQAAQSGWVDLGTYEFAAGTDGFVRLDDLTGEPLSQSRGIFFDSVQFVREEPGSQSLALDSVSLDRTTVAAGELLKVTFMVRNSGSAPIFGQDPQAGTRADEEASFDLANSYVYDEGECFLGTPGQDYPTFLKEAGRFRVTMGPVNREAPCAGNTGSFPWRWGVNGRLEPGESREVVGYVRFREPGQVTLRFGAIQEYVAYMPTGIADQTITITPERQQPATTGYDSLLRPLAEVYRLGELPDNFLARTRNPLSIVKGERLGSFVWEGELRDWGEGGPLEGVSEGFIVEQTRVFIAPVDGEYIFQVTSDDGAWLWVNGAPVIERPGLHPADSVTGTIWLAAGRHVLGFKYFERSGAAVAGYSVQMPGSASFANVIDGLAGVGVGQDWRLGARFRQLHGLTLAAADMGGSGPAVLRVSFDGQTWADAPGGLLTMGQLTEGSYELYYKAIDAAGNESPVSSLRFLVDSTIQVERVYLPLVLQ